VDGLAAALIRLLDDPSLARALGERGYESASRHFTWTAVGARMKAVIDAAVPPA
jgi:glycosyltransferase involved in cell wall biosynthesis